VFERRRKGERDIDREIALEKGRKGEREKWC
jgi:hypothetical protein